MPTPTLQTPANPVISVDANGLVIGVATSANQTATVSALNALAAQFPATLGPKPSANSLSVAPSSDGVFTVNGNAASAAADTGNPIKVGGRYNASGTTLADGQRGDLQLNANSALLIQIIGANRLSPNVLSASAAISTSNSGLLTISATQNYNPIASAFAGTLGDGTGTWVHAPANSVSTTLSGTIAASGGTAAVAFVNSARQEVINPSTATLWASWGIPAVNGAGSFPIVSGGSYSTDRTAGTLTILSTAANQPFTVNRFS